MLSTATSAIKEISMLDYFLEYFLGLPRTGGW